jgi:hypothetical protein
VHFRPWQGGLLEEWGLALAWRQEGFGGYFARLPLLMGRPVHLLPYYVGDVLSNGGFVGPYAVLAAVAVGQFLLTLWALRPLTSMWVPRWVLGMALALHPVWAAGDLLRYLPAQTAVLGVVVWLGAVTRYLRGGSRKWLLLAGAALAVGLLAYQAPAAAVLAGAVALAVATAEVRRGAVAIAVTGASVVGVFLWSMVVAPLLSSSSYESDMASGAGLGPVRLVRAVIRTLVLYAPGVLLTMGVAAVFVIALGLNRQLTRTQVGLLLAVVAAAPLAALVYAANAADLNDPERVALPASLVPWLVLAAIVHRLSEPRVLAVGLLVAALACGSVSSVVAYSRWSGLAAAQQELIRAAGAARDAVPAGATLVAADTSGRYGDVYLLLPPHLDIALDVEYGIGPKAVLCTASGVARDHPVAARFPLDTTPDCGTYLGRPDVVGVGSVQTGLGRVEFYAVP